MFRFRFRFRHSYYGPGKHAPFLIGLKGLVDSGSVKEQNTALSFELIKLINHPLKNLKFQGLFLRRKRQTSYYGLCVVFIECWSYTISDVMKN